MSDNTYEASGYMRDLIQQGIQIFTNRLKKEFTGSGFEFLVMVFPYHLTQIAHLSSEQRALIERRVALAAQKEFRQIMKEKGRGRES